MKLNKLYKKGQDGLWYEYNKYSELFELMNIIRVCRFCGEKETNIQLELHHVIPKSIGGTDNNRVLICTKCHDITHNIIPKLLWGHIRGKDEARITLINFIERKKKYNHIIQKRGVEHV